VNPGRAEAVISSGICKNRRNNDCEGESMTVTMPQQGEPAPGFQLPAWPEGEVSLDQFTGVKKVVLFFYPRDDTPG